MSVSDLALAAPAGLEWLQPQQQFLLIDQSRTPVSSAGHNLVTALFGLQRCRSRSSCQNVVETLVAWVKEESNQMLRESLSSWISRYLRHKLKRDRPALGGDIMDYDLEDKEFDSWEECLLDELMHGRAEGREEGLAKGRQEGREEGREQAARDLLLRLLTRRGQAVAAEWAQSIEAARLVELEEWLERLYDGAPPSVLFGAPASGS